MRVEVHGCLYNSPVSSYQAPQGEDFSPHIFLEDIYDGEKDGLILRGGLGLLSDGNIGKHLSFTQHGIGQGIKSMQTNCYKTCLFSANGWVGWTNKKSPLELIFIFKSFQSIQEVNIVAFNKPDMGIGVR